MKTENQSVLRVLNSGLASSLQDCRRRGWRRWGVPASGPMDAHSALCANRLVENATNCAVIELLLQGARFEVLQPAWIAICGADILSNVPTGRAHLASPGEVISIDQCRNGLWSYLAVEGGFASELIFGSASYYARGRIGRPLEKGTVLHRQATSRFQLARGVAGRMATWSDRRNFSQIPPIRVYPGPQWKLFAMADRERFLTAVWNVSAQSDRVGYRLAGPALKAEPAEIVSEPVLTGSVQVPENGQPIVTMPDGPTVGGYPKIALAHSADLSWLAQARPGQNVRFQLAT